MRGRKPKGVYTPEQMAAFEQARDAFFMRWLRDDDDPWRSAEENDAAGAAVYARRRATAQRRLPLLQQAWVKGQAARREAEELCRDYDLPEPAWPLGIDEQGRPTADDQTRASLVKALHDAGAELGLPTWEMVYIEAGKMLGVSADAVRKSYAREKARREKVVGADCADDPFCRLWLLE